MCLPRFHVFQGTHSYESIWSTKEDPHSHLSSQNFYKFSSQIEKVIVTHAHFVLTQIGSHLPYQREVYGTTVNLCNFLQKMQDLKVEHLKPSWQLYAVKFSWTIGHAKMELVPNALEPVSVSIIRSTSDEAPHCAIFSSLPYLPPS